MNIPDISNNYEFKLVKRMMMRDYPWIKDVIPSVDDNDEYRAISFVDVLIDPYQLSKEKGFAVAEYVTKLAGMNGLFRSPFLSTFFERNRYELKSIVDEIENKIRTIHDTNTIPREYKNKKKFLPSEWIYHTTPK